MSKISIRKDTKQRINAFAAYIDEAGTRYPTVPPEVFEWVEPPEPPAEYTADPAHYTVAEVDDAPYVVYTRKSDEQIAELARAKAKAERQVAVEAITVTTAAGNTFDGDETSQTRMSRAILVLSTGAAASVPWVLADNTVIQADIAELTEALALAGAEQARLWVL